MLEVKVKKFHENAVLPTYAKSGDACVDLTAVSKGYDEEGNVVYGTGLGFEIPEDYVGLIFPRSSNAKKDLILSNSVGVIDSGYRGEVAFKFKYSKPNYDVSEVYDGLDGDKHWRVRVSDGDLKEYEIGDRIGQIMIIPRPKINFVEVESLSESERGSTGFGSSGA